MTDNQYDRDKFVIDNLTSIPKGQNILDAGCGSQRYKKHCSNLKYLTQDFGKYDVDEKEMFNSINVESNPYNYGEINYLGNIWEINETDSFFDNILCTEVFEHIPKPNETIKEFSRVIKTGGKLILTAPFSCLRHMDPYFFYTGFSDRWYENILKENNFKIIEIIPVGDYNRYMLSEIYRTIRRENFFISLFLLPSLLYFLFKKPNTLSINSLCMGYHVVAIKK
ncbi:methyltransferase domain-containing protein [Methylophilaceae bacterium]|nr:methyltransferase domain-containing protein [Methylophilaceae bacterium]